MAISKQMKKYILNAEKGGYTSATRSTYDKRLFRYVTNIIEDLAFLAKNLWETHPDPKGPSQATIFNADQLAPLFRSIFRVEESNTLTEQKRLRILKLCNCVLDEIKIHNHGPLLAPNAWKVLRETPSSSYHDAMYGTKVIQAIQIEGTVFRPNDSQERAKPEVHNEKIRKTGKKWQ